MNNIVMMSPSDIRPYERNPRKNDDAVEYVANSIREFGFRQPIVVDKDMTIIVGHTRLTEKEMEIIDRLNREDGCPICPE